MRVKINADLAKAVSEAARFVPSAGKADVFKTILFQASGNTASVTAYNGLGAFYRESVEAEVAEEGAIALYAPLLSDIVQHYCGDIVVKGADVSVSDSTGRFETVGMEADSFPQFPEVNAVDASFALDGGLLKDLFKQVAYAGKRLEWAGVKVFSRKGSLYADAVDGYRAARVSVALPETVNAADIVPTFVPLTIVDQILGDKRYGAKTTVQIIKTARNIIFESGGVQIVSPVVVKQILDLDTVLKPNNMTVLFSTERLRGVMGKLSLITGQPGYKGSAQPLIFRYEVAAGKAEFSLKCSTASFQESVECSASAFSHDVCMGLNPVFLEDALKAISADTVKLNVGKPLAPVYLIPHGDGGAKAVHMILPVRIHAGDAGGTGGSDE